MFIRYFSCTSTEFELKTCLLGSVEITKNAIPDKFKYSSSDIGFDFCSEFSINEDSFCKNVIIFGADISLSVHN